MKKILYGFLRRGINSCGIGPMVLAILYLIMHGNGFVETLSVEQVCTGIFSLAALAFIAGGMNVVYQAERLPLMAAILIHGVVLYITYLLTYLLNDWLEWGMIPVMVFTAIFVVGYLVIWAVIYSIIKRNTKKINETLNRKRLASAGE